MPADGNPLSTTLPVGTAQLGCVIVPIAGAVGVTGCVFTTAFPDEADVQPDALVTVKVHVPAGILVTVVLIPDPVVIVPPGFLVSVQLPVDGSPLSATLPVDNAQVGCVMVPITGAVGVTG